MNNYEKKLWNSTISCEQERENFAKGGVKFVSRAYDMQSRKLPLKKAWDYTSL